MIEELLDSVHNHQIDISEHSGIMVSDASIFIDKGKFSIVYGQCMRAAYYRIIGLSKKRIDTLGKYIKYNVFSKVKSSIASLLTLNNKLVNCNVQITHDVPKITGNIDIVATSGFKEYGVKIFMIDPTKTSLSSIFSTNAFPKIEHIIQASIALNLYRTKISEMYILYIRSDTYDAKSFKIQNVRITDGQLASVDGQVYKTLKLSDIYKRFVKLEAHITNRSTPPADYQITFTKEYLQQIHEAGLISEKQYLANIKSVGQIGDKKCLYCNYKDICALEP